MNDKDTVEFHVERLDKLTRYIRTILVARELAQASGKSLGIAFMQLDDLPCPACAIRQAFKFG